MAGAPKGNNNGTKGRPWIRALERIVQQDPEKLRKIALKVFAMAAEGDMQAVKEIADRLDGKPVQQVQMEASFTNALAQELTNEQLAIIAAGGTLNDSDDHSMETLQ